MELVRQEGEVRLTARGLPAPGAMHYVLWIAREGTDDVYRLGEPRPQPDGTTVLDLLLPSAVPNRGWNLALLTVEDSPTPDRPGPRHSLAGRFPQFSPEGPLPRSLPNTGLGGGASPGDADVPLIGWAVAGLTLMIIGGTVERAWRSRAGGGSSAPAHSVRVDASVADRAAEPGTVSPRKNNRRL